MANIGLNLKKLVVIGSASVFGLLAVPLVADYMTDGMSNMVATAQAAEDGHGSAGGHSGSGGSGDKGQVTKGAGGSHESGAGGPSKAVEAVVSEEEGGKGSMGSGVHGQGSFQDNKQKGGGSAPGPGGINDEPNDAKGPRYSGGAGTGSKGGKPAWAQEGIPVVELGRLNVARAPGKLLDKQLVEALTTLSTIVGASGTSIYEAPNLTAAIAQITTDALRIDSPLANLALLKDFLSDGVVDGNYVVNDGAPVLFDPAMSDAEFVAVLLGSASDKTVAISKDTVTALETILGLEMGDDAAIATMADDVREAILFAHDN